MELRQGFGGGGEEHGKDAFHARAKIILVERANIRIIKYELSIACKMKAPGHPDDQRR